jgi:uncharacterized membrane protein AbrB (regulator of aidB expression)
VTERERRAWLRLLLVAAAAALGETWGTWQRIPSSDLAVPLLLGGAVFALTGALTAPRVRRGENVRYWRGRRVDED